MVCQRCKSTRLVVISMSLRGESNVTFRSCRDCEHHWWAAVEDDQNIALDAVLELAKVNRSCGIGRNTL